MLASELWQAWWVWIAAGLILAILEVLVPGYIFLGFALGALVVGILLATGLLPLAAPGLLVLFAVLSLLAYVVLRNRFKSGQGQVKIIRHDINDN